MYFDWAFTQYIQKVKHGEMKVGTVKIVSTFKKSVFCPTTTMIIMMNEMYSYRLQAILHDVDYEYEYTTSMSRTRLATRTRSLLVYIVRVVYSLSSA